MLYEGNGKEMMYPKRAIGFLEIERECVSRDCDRNCSACDLAQDRDELLSAYDCVIQFLKEHTASYLPRLEWHRTRRKWLYYCGNCGRGILRVPSAEEDGGNYCVNCGRRIDWRVWLNEKEYFEKQEAHT